MRKRIIIWVILLTLSIGTLIVICTFYIQKTWSESQSEPCALGYYYCSYDDTFNQFLINVSFDLKTTLPCLFSKAPDYGDYKSSRSYAINDCRAYVLAKTKDPKKCNLLEIGADFGVVGDSTLCYEQIAVGAEDIELCTDFPTESRCQCYFYVAKNTHNEEVCHLIESNSADFAPYWKRDCLKLFVEDNTTSDTTQISTLPEGTVEEQAMECYRRYIDTRQAITCIIDVAIARNDNAICEEIFNKTYYDVEYKACLELHQP